MNPVQPIFFLPNRVQKYTGQGLLDRFLDDGYGTGENFGQEWLVSTTPAGDPASPETGLSRISEDGRPGPLLTEAAETFGEILFGTHHLERFGPDTGLNCRLIDCARNPPGMCCSSGPTCINVIGVVEKYGLFPRMLIGRDTGGGNREAVNLEVQAGRTLHIPPGTPYRLGEGMLVLQVSAKGDRIEHDLPPGETVTFESETDTTRILKDLRPREVTLLHNNMGVITESVSNTSSQFKIQRTEIAGTMELKQENAFSIILCAAGTGGMAWAGGFRDVKSGDYFLQPYALGWISFTADEHLCLIKIQPSYPN